ncbi:MAG: DUF1311 domain-containing protein [Akkermansiaceae bacterium]|jgi:uncharacterized protein YecT (DUF1311 family)|nr:DUF1311 domain-containing protein [Akkermansiaceae bacterium]
MIRLITLLVMSASLAFSAELEDAKAAFAKQDKALNAAYAGLKKDLAPEIFAKVQEDQRGWVEYREAISDFQTEGEEKENSAAWFETAAGMTESRIEWLEAWRKATLREGWEGRYSDGFGGLLEIVEEGGKVHFRLSVVRGPTYHSGEIGGVLRINGGTAWFETQGEDSEDPTWLTFLEEHDGSGRITVHGENTSYFHGMRAYFEGSYLWLGKLSAEDRKAVLEPEEQ